MRLLRGIARQYRTHTQKSISVIKLAIKQRRGEVFSSSSTRIVFVVKKNKDLIGASRRKLENY